MSEPSLARASTARPRLRRLSIKFASIMRWLHIYLSMLGLFALLFFSATGITLNHPDWFSGGAARSTEAEGAIRPDWLKDVAKLEVVEHLRKAHAIRGAVAEFTVDDTECMVAFKGPGYSADVFIDRSTGKYRLTETAHGLVAIVNDLHKGRDTGAIWSIVIDASAILLILASLSGLVLLFYIKRRRISGTVVGILGMLILVAIVYLLVP
jgi:uncharacterized protein